MKGNDKLAIQCAMLMACACASAFGYSNPIEGGTTEVVTNQWNVPLPWLMVGSNSGSNTLEVVDGGLVYNQIGYLGNTAGSTHNQAIVTGSGVWSNAIELSVGYAGASNSLTVADGATVATPNAYIGNISDGNQATVTGSGSQLNATTLNVGHQGDGNRLLVTDGGTVESDTGTIGYWIGSDNNMATVRSNGIWNSSTKLNVGEYGSGNQLVVGAGGLVESPVVNVGVQTTSSNNTVTVTGEGAWLEAPELYIGGSAAGAGSIGNLVEVESGGTVYTESLNIYSNNAFDLNDGGRLFVNTNFNASTTNFNWNAGGTLEVGGELTGMTNSIEDQRTLVLNGSSARWDRSFSDIKIGEFTGSNALSIVNGGYLETAEAYIGYASGADSNSVLVSGSNTVWDNLSELYVGYQGSGNSLVVTDGAEVNTSFARVGLIGSSSNSLVVADGGSFLSTGILTIGGFYPPNLLSTDNSLVVTNGGNVQSGGGFIAHSSSALVSETGSTWFIGDVLSISHESSLTVNEGGTVSTARFSLGSRFASPHLQGDQLIVSGQGSMLEIRENDSPNDFQIDGIGSLVRVEDGGQILVDGGSKISGADHSVIVTGSNSLWNSSVLGIDGSQNAVVIEDEGALVSRDCFIGDLSGTSNSVLVTGDRSIWHNTGFLRIGNAGSYNSLTIEDGGLVANGDSTFDYQSGSTIGYQSGSDYNSVLVTGEDSLWQSYNNLHLGGRYEAVLTGSGYVIEWANGGYGNSLAVEDGGRVLVGDVDTNALAGIGGGIIVGDANGAEMVVANASSLHTVNSWIGLGTAEQGTVEVRGSGSVWTNSGDFIVGYEGTFNALNITSGGAVYNENAYIGYASGADSNSVLVTGSGSVWQNDEGFYLGGHYEGTNWVDGGTGNSLTVGDGAWVLVGDVDISNLRDSSINYGGGIAVGDADGAEMVVANGSHVTNGPTYIGLGSNDVGSVLITGSNTFWIGAFAVGYKGSGNSLTIADGAHVSSGPNYIGWTPGAGNNSVLLTGAGTVWDMSPYFTGVKLEIGAKSSSNTLTIADGGRLVSNIGQIGSNGIFDYGADSENNSVLITGAGSVWENLGGTNAWTSDALQGALSIGGTGSTLAVLDGGAVYTRSLSVGNYSDTSNNTVTVSGAGSLLDCWGGVSIGNRGTGNDLIVSDGGRAQFDRRVIVGGYTGSENRILVTGTNSVLSHTGELYVGNRGSNNSLIIEDGGRVETLASYVEDPGGFVGYAANARSNQVVVSGSGSVWTNSGDVYIGYDGSYNTLNITNGGTVYNENAYIGYSVGADSNSVLVTDSGSVWQNDEGLYLGGHYEGTNWVDDGSGNSLTVEDGGLVSVGDDMHNRNYSSVNLDPGGLITIGGYYYQDASSMLRFGVETNAVGTPVNALMTVGGTAEFEEGAQIEYASNVGELLFDRFYTNKLIEADTLVVAGINNADSLDLELLDASGSLVDVIFWENDQDIYALAGRRYLADSAGFDEDSMMGRLSKEIDDMSLLGRSGAMGMIDLLNTMSGSEQNEELVQQYAYSTPNYLHIQGMTEGLGELTKHTSRRPAAAPEGASGPHRADQGARGWVRPYGTWSERTAHDGFAGYDHNVYGTLVGMDWIQSNVLLGIAGGYARSNIKQDDGGDSEANTGYGVFYASLGTKDWFGDISIAAGRSDIEDESGTAFGAHADYKASNFALYLGGGKEMRSRSGRLSLTPATSLLLSDYYRNGYTEKMDTGVAREMASYENSSVLSSLGATLAVQKEYDIMVLKPEARLRWLHEFCADADAADYTLVGGTGGNYQFLMPAAEENIIEAGAGLSCTFDDELSLVLDIDWRFGEDYDAYSVSGRAVVEF